MFLVEIKWFVSDEVLGCLDEGLLTILAFESIGSQIGNHVSILNQVLMIIIDWLCDHLLFIFQRYLRGVDSGIVSGVLHGGSLDTFCYFIMALGVVKFVGKDFICR